MSEDVLIEGKVVLKNYDPGTKGFSTADQHAFEIVVNDHYLDIDFQNLEKEYNSNCKC